MTRASNLLTGAAIAVAIALPLLAPGYYVQFAAKAMLMGMLAPPNLGRDFKVIASMGHVRDLPKSKLGVDVDGDFVAIFQAIEERAGRQHRVRTVLTRLRRRKDHDRDHGSDRGSLRRDTDA